MTPLIDSMLVRQVAAGAQSPGRHMVVIAGPAGPADTVAEHLADAAGIRLVDRFAEPAAEVRAALKGEEPFLIVGSMTIPNSLDRIGWKAADDSVDSGGYRQQTRAALAGCVGVHRDYSSSDIRTLCRFITVDELVMCGVVPPPWDADDGAL